MSAIGFRPRTDRLAEVLRDDGIDAFFATSPVSMRYLHGFGEGGHERFLTLAVRDTGETRLICPSLSETQARRSGVRDIRAWRDGEDPLAHFRVLCDDWALRSAILAVDDEMPAQMLLKMQAVLPAALFKAGQPAISRLMRRKEPAELDSLREAASIADRALAAGLAAIQPGASEADIQAALWSEMRRLGGEPTFCIVAAGANGAEPHHLSDDTRIERGDVIIMDFGCGVDGYQSDITRTVCCGLGSPEAKAAYRAVFDAQRAGREAVRVGGTCGEVDDAARSVIAAAGMGEFFIHRTGHGIGMRGHEEPYIVGGSEEVLEESMCFSVEPGVYFPGRFGVRIENIVTVTSDGAASLNEEPSDALIEVE